MAHPDYFASLKRLIAGDPKRIPHGYSINNDTVALEAGRQRGSIKKARDPRLVQAIQEAAEAQSSTVDKSTQRIAKAQSKVQYYRSLAHEALNREAMHRHTIESLELEIKRLQKLLAQYKTY